MSYIYVIFLTLFGDRYLYLHLYIHICILSLHALKFSLGNTSWTLKHSKREMMKHFKTIYF